MTAPPFDLLAPTYDQDFTDSVIARHLRERTWARLTHHFHMDDRVLEIGCGTGEDAHHLARRGIPVLATDPSPVMLERARAKCESVQRASGRNTPLHIDFSHLDLSALPDDFERDFKGVYANFGALNCTDAWNELAVWLAARIAPNGIAAFGVMARGCLWEIAWHGLHYDFRTAIRRLSGRSTFAPTGSAPMTIHYPTVATLTRAFAPHFRRIRVEPLGLFLPPSDIYGVIERRPQLLKRLTAWDDRIGRAACLANFADHYWIEFRRR